MRHRKWRAIQCSSAEYCISVSYSFFLHPPTCICLLYSLSKLSYLPVIWFPNCLAQTLVFVLCLVYAVTHCCWTKLRLLESALQPRPRKWAPCVTVASSPLAKLPFLCWAHFRLQPDGSLTRAHHLQLIIYVTRWMKVSQNALSFPLSLTKNEYHLWYILGNGHHFKMVCVNKSLL